MSACEVLKERIPQSGWCLNDFGHEPVYKQARIYVIKPVVKSRETRAYSQRDWLTSFDEGCFETKESKQFERYVAKCVIEAKLRKSIRALTLPVKGSEEYEVFDNAVHKLSECPIVKSSVTYDEGMFYFALYMREELKVVFSLYCDDGDRAYVTFSSGGNIIREESLTLSQLVIAIKKIYKRIDD